MTVDPTLEANGPQQAAVAQDRAPRAPTSALHDARFSDSLAWGLGAIMQSSNVDRTGPGAHIDTRHVEMRHTFAAYASRRTFRRRRLAPNSS